MPARIVQTSSLFSYQFSFKAHQPTRRLKQNKKRRNEKENLFDTYQMSCLLAFTVVLIRVVVALSPLRLLRCLVVAFFSLVGRFPSISVFPPFFFQNFDRRARSRRGPQLFIEAPKHTGSPVAFHP